MGQNCPPYWNEIFVAFTEHRVLDIFKNDSCMKNLLKMICVYQKIKRNLKNVIAKYY